MKDEKENIKKNKIRIYYENQMTNNTEMDEKIIKDIIRQKTKCKDDNNKLDLIIYYKGIKTKSLIIKNNSNNNSILQMSHVVYKINCPV